MRVLVVANGDPGSGPPPGPFDRIIAADGGARLCRRFALRPDLVVGDMDSLPTEDRDALAAGGADLRIHPDPMNKEETDLELALAAAALLRPDEIVLWGIWGDRPDHTMANVLALAHPMLKRVSCRAFAGGWWAQLVRPSRQQTLDAVPGATISLISLAPHTSGIVTTGLRYPLPAPWDPANGGLLVRGSGRGLSNAVAQAPASIRCKTGLLLAVYQSAPPASGAEQ